MTVWFCPASRSQGRHQQRSIAGVLALGLLAVVATSGCVKSKQPLLAPSDAVFPFGDYARFQEYSFSMTKNKWSETVDAELKNNDGEYSFTVHDEYPIVATMKRINVGDFGEMYLVQTKEWTDYQYGVVVVNANVPFPQRDGNIAVLRINCPQSGATDNNGDCEATDLESLMTIIKANDWKTRIPKAGTIYRLMK
jgi:hypothetical protein